MQTQTWPHAISNQRFASFPQSPNRLRYGLRQESELRRGLGADHKLRVHYNTTEDTIYKMDAIVRFRDAPLLPAVGIQFTTKRDPDKMSQTIAAVRRTRIVSRLLYLEAECSLSEPVFALISGLIRFLAKSSCERGIVCAVLASDGQGKYWLRDLKCFPLETSAAKTEQQNEEKAA